MNKNPVAEKAIAELESGILRQDSTGDTLTAVALSLAKARFNSCMRLSCTFRRNFAYSYNSFPKQVGHHIEKRITVEDFQLYVIT